MTSSAPWARQAIPIAALLILLAAVPYLGGRYEIYLVTEILIYALFATALNLMVGFGGLISFGHAAYFGIGAYSLAVFGTTLNWPLPLMFAGTIIISALSALIIGFFCVRLKSIFLGMLTLAFGQFVWAVAHQWTAVTKGDTGFMGLRIPNLISGPQPYYYFVLVVVVLCTVILWRITKSPFGKILVSTRENEMRAEFVGVDVKRIQLIAFVISGTFSGIAGGLFAMFNRSVFPEVAWWTKSAEILIMSILGGIYSFIGPAIGAAAIIALKSIITEHTQYWPTVLGIILLIVLFALPDGLVGMIKRLARRGSPGKAGS